MSGERESRIIPDSRWWPIRAAILRGLPLTDDPDDQSEPARRKAIIVANIRNRGSN